MSVTLALLNGKIYTLGNGTCEAMAFSGEKIAEVGSTKEIDELCDEKTTRIDLKGRVVFPGFDDSHMHLLEYSSFLDKVNLRGAASIKEVIKRTQDFIRNTKKKPGEWVLGWGWDQNLFKDNKLPNKDDIDKISTNNPILLNRTCGHIGVVNTLALRTMGINEDTYIEGGIIDKDSDGKPNGILREMALTWFISRLPKPNKEQIRYLIDLGISETLKVGLTSLQTDDFDFFGFGICDDLLNTYNEMVEKGELPLRMYEEVETPNQKIMQSFFDRGLRTGSGNDYFKIGPIKLYADGFLGARTAALESEYSDDPGSTGVLVYTDEELNDLVMKAHSEGMQVAIHVIGDRALRQAVNAIERALVRSPREARHRIVYCQIGTLPLFEKMAKLGITSDIQPPFVSSDWRMVEERIGSERAKASYAWKTMMNMGIKVGGGSDCPIESFNPLWGIYAAVTRKDLEGNPPNGWLPQEKLTVREAISLYTEGSAYMSFEETKKGTIEKEKLADVVVLNHDPYETAADNLKDIKVLATIVGGKVRFIDEKNF